MLLVKLLFVNGGNTRNLAVRGQGHSQKFVLVLGGYRFFWGGIKLQYSCTIAVLTSFLPHKKFELILGVYTF